VGLDIPAFTKSDPTRFLADSTARDAEQYQLGQSVSLALTKTRRKHSLESDLRRNWKAEGVGLDTPAFKKSDTTRLHIDSTAKEVELGNMKMNGVVSFDLDVVRPQAYTLPKPKKEDDQKKKNSSSRENSLEHEAEAATKAKTPSRAFSDGSLPDGPRVETPGSEPHEDNYEQLVEGNLTRFLDWAINDDEAEEERDSSTNHTESHVERILHALHEARVEDEVVEKANAYKWVKGTSQTSVETMMLSLKSNKSNGDTQDSAEKQAEFASSFDAESPESRKSSTAHASIGERGTEDQLHAELIEKCNLSVTDFHRLFTQLLECYTLPTNGHVLILGVSV
jgi:hypothetical protein